MPQGFELSSLPIDTALLACSLTDAAAGALVTFEGRVRNTNEGKHVQSLTYEAYEALALGQGVAVINETHERYPIVAARCVHRVGHLAVGEVAVWVGVIAGHREEAFAACRFIIDEVKRRVPIWKKERYAEGETAWIAEEHELD